MLADDEDPTANSIKTPGFSSHIPIDFKLRVTKEVYNMLDVEEKKKVDDRCEEEWKKLYWTVLEIQSAKERDGKLLMHQQ